MHLTVIPSDKQIYLETTDVQFPNRRCHIIDNDQQFWDSVDPRIHAIQYHSDGQKEFELKNPSENVPITDVSILQKYMGKFILNQASLKSILLNCKTLSSSCSL